MGHPYTKVAKFTSNRTFEDKGGKGDDVEGNEGNSDNHGYLVRILVNSGQANCIEMAKNASEHCTSYCIHCIVCFFLIPLMCT